MAKPKVTRPMTKTEKINYALEAEGVPAPLNEVICALVDAWERTLPARAVQDCAKAAVSHWNEFGPEHGFQERMHYLDEAIKKLTGVQL